VGEDGSRAPLTTSSVNDHVTLTGDAPVTIDDGTITYRQDQNGDVTVEVTVTSTGTTAVTMQMRASLLDKSGTIVGDATGAGPFTLAAGAGSTVDLSGPPPHGQIAAVTFEGTTLPLSTPS